MMHPASAAFSAASVLFLCLSLPGQHGGVVGETAPGVRPPAPIPGTEPEPQGGAEPQSGVWAVPAAARASFGSTNNNIPFSWTPNRYQQIFRGSELPTTGNIAGVALRQDNSFQGHSGHTIEIAIDLGYSSLTESTLTSTFASNWSASPTNVLSRQKVVLPNMPNAAITDPAVFFCRIYFDSPFVWAQSRGNLLFEVRNHGNSNNNSTFTYPLDAHSGPGVTTSRLYNLSSPTATTGTLDPNTGLVMCFLERGNFTNYGAPCAGSAYGSCDPCIASNPSGGTLSLTQNTNVFALEFTAPANMVCCGFEFYTQATSTPVLINTELLNAASGKPGAVIATGTMSIGSRPDWYSTSFAPVSLTGGSKYYLSYQPSTGMMFPVVTTGTTAVHFFHAPTTTTWNGPFTSQRWAWKVLCQDVKSIVPAAQANAFGNTNNNIPFSSTPTRYQQIVDGRELSPYMLMREMALRQDNAFSGHKGQTLDMEIKLGYTTHTKDTLTNTFASNFNSGAPNTVFPRGNFTLPDMPNSPPSSPSIFLVHIPFATTFLWQDNALTPRNLLVEVIIHGNSNNNTTFTYPLDAASATNATRLFGGATATTGTLGRNFGLVMCFLGSTSRSAPFISHTGWPHVGGSFDIDLHFAISGAPAALIFGFSRTGWGPIPLPLSLAGFGAPGCFLNASYDLLLGVKLTDGWGRASLPFAIPPIPSLAGKDFYSQWFVLDPRANAWGLVFSNGGKATIGS